MGSTFYFDGTAVAQVKEDEIAVKSVDSESSKDNRNLLDRSDNQLLTAEEIRSLKSAGSSGNVRLIPHFQSSFISRRLFPSWWKKAPPFV